MSASCRVTRPACTHARSESSNIFTRYASDASCNARSAVLCMRRSSCGLICCTTSRTSLWKGIFGISSSVVFWYFRIWRSATVPGRYREGFLMPPHLYLYACLVASFLRGHLPPLLFRAVCFVRAIFSSWGLWSWSVEEIEKWLWRCQTRENNGLTPGMTFPRTIFASYPGYEISGNDARH